jgi:DNA-binding transcriptional LysR family regulator
MNWDDFKLALAVARTGSLNQAALLLDLNQSTVSRRLTALEADLGATLFRRSHLGLVPTEAGSVFVARAAEIEARTEALVETIRQTDMRPAGVIRLLGSPWVVQQLIRSGLPAFLTRSSRHRASHRGRAARLEPLAKRAGHRSLVRDLAGGRRRRYPAGRGALCLLPGR